MKKIIYISVSLLLLLDARVASSQIAGNWTLLGPIQWPVNDQWEMAGIGRIEQIKFDPTNASKLYATSANGGLFVSTNGATTWTSTGTDSVAAIGANAGNHGEGGSSVASVCIDYTNDQILYIGTGDANYYYSTYVIWKSTNGGATWTSSDSGIGNRLAIEILMSPHNHNILIAATDDGIWRSTDAGAGWTEVNSGGSYTDMQLKPSPTTSTIYATTDGATSAAFWVSNDGG